MGNFVHVHWASAGIEELRWHEIRVSCGCASELSPGIQELETIHQSPSESKSSFKFLVDGR